MTPGWLRESQLVGRIYSPTNSTDCPVDCIFAGEPHVEVRADCGRKQDARRQLELPAGARPINKLEVRAYVEETPTDRILKFSDQDTPCTVVIRWDIHDPSAEAKAIGLGRDVAKALTPEVVAKRRTVEALVWAQDETGERAQAALSTWDQDSAGMKTLVEFAAGFPKLMDHKDREGLPPGKKSLLLGYCANDKASRTAGLLAASLPGAQWYRVAAGSTGPLSCPTSNPKVDLSSVETKHKLVGKFALSVLGLQQHRVDSDADRRGVVHAYLRDRAGRLVDFRKAELSDSLNLCTSPTVKSVGAGVTVDIACAQSHDPRDYPRCKTTPKVVTTTRITVKDGKITMTTTDGPRPDCMCCN